MFLPKTVLQTDCEETSSNRCFTHSNPSFLRSWLSHRTHAWPNLGSNISQHRYLVLCEVARRLTSPVGVADEDVWVFSLLLPASKTEINSPVSGSGFGFTSLMFELCPRLDQTCALLSSESLSCELRNLMVE